MIDTLENENLYTSGIGQWIRGMNTDTVLCLY